MKTENEALEVQRSDDTPGSLLQVIAHAVSDPRLDVDKLSKLLDVHERIVADQRKTAFMAAMARLTPKLPEIGKHGQSHHGRYARLEDIDRAIRPLIAEEGFSLSFDSGPAEGGKVRVTCRLSHADGHSETKQIDLPLDTSGSKNGAQSVISTVSYGRRALTKMFFNLIEAGEDTDANDLSVITEEQARDMEAKITEVGADKKRFLTYMGVAATKDILAKDWTKALNAIETKRQAKK